MRIKVRHATRYRYAEPATSALQLLRLTPRPFDGQFVRRWRVGINSDARLERSEDAFGNITHMVFVEGPLSEVEILIEGEVETTDTGGIVSGAVERQPEALFKRETLLTRPSPAIRRWAREAAAAQGGEVLATMHAMSRALCRDMTFDVGATDSTTAAAVAFERRAGVCQDFAHILLAGARSLAIPARYVSGYYLRTDRTDQEAGHAWIEARIPNLGWVGFDPSHGLSTDERYVRVATGCDAREAAPVRGARHGGGGERLEVALQVSQSRLSGQN